MYNESCPKLPVFGKNPRHMAYRTEFCEAPEWLFKTLKTGTIMGGI
jgi:hypothetical protein